MLIYKIFTQDQWHTLDSEGQTLGAPVDLNDGFIHFSTAEQVAETAAKHFAGQNNLVLAAFEADELGDLRWEVSRGGALFPHLYDPLFKRHLRWQRPLPWDGARHQFPELT